MQVRIGDIPAPCILRILALIAWLRNPGQIPQLSKVGYTRQCLRAVKFFVLQVSGHRVTLSNRCYVSIGVHKFVQLA